MFDQNLIQIAGVIDAAEADTRQDCGVSCLGFPLRLPVNQEDISEQHAATIDPATGASGATGKIHDWSISRRLVELSKRPVILAGGLGPENVRRAILEVKPAGVDSHTGVEDDDGRKCRDKVERFMAEAQIGFNLLTDGSHG